MSSQSSARRTTAWKLFDNEKSGAISLRGASSVAASSESILRRAREERSRRAAQRAQEEAASRIQALWRRYDDLRGLYEEFNESLFRITGTRSSGTSLELTRVLCNQHCLQKLCFIFTFSDGENQRARLLWDDWRESIRQLICSTALSNVAKSRLFVASVLRGDEAFVLENAGRCSIAIQRAANRMFEAMQGRSAGYAALEVCRRSGPTVRFAKLILSTPSFPTRLTEQDLESFSHMFAESVKILIIDEGNSLDVESLHQIRDLILSLPPTETHIFLLKFVTDRLGISETLTKRLQQDEVYLRNLIQLLGWNPENWGDFASLLEKYDAIDQHVCSVLAFWHSRDFLRQMWHSLRHSSSGSLLRLFSESFRISTLVMDDDDFYESSNLAFVSEVSAELKEQLFWKLYSATAATHTRNKVLWDFSEPDTVQAASRLLLALWARDARRPFSTESAARWEVPAARKASELFVRESIRKSCDVPLLRMAPFTVPFETRVRIFHGCVAQEKARAGGGLSFFGMNGVWVTIRRNFIFEDAFAQLNALGSRLRENIRVKFVDEHGLEEAGVDGGGVFKEFMHQLVRLSFSPSHYGLFKATDGGELYPNPASSVIAPTNHLEQFTFLGRILGKALYDAILVDLPIASFFLRKLLGISNDLNDLRSLDPELHRNLRFLKYADPESFSDLGLTFTVVDNNFGEAIEKELLPGGGSLPVTWNNRLEYMHRVADYRLNRQIRQQTTAFISGFFDVVQKEWIEMFNERELCELISGDRSGKIDNFDLRSNVVYSGGYSETSETVQLFWAVVEEDLSDDERAALLQFVTSSPRAPLLGFQFLNPPFCIQKAGEDESRYPTASTCMNLLKLPPYSSRETMREKLKYAIMQNTGFGLS